MSLEKMNEFFDKRADSYDHHMLVDLQLTEFYEEIANCFPVGMNNQKLLDLGCGTGLELEQLFAKISMLSVTGVDLSQEMLNVLKAKYADKELKLICGSYFDVDFGEQCFDYALSTYSLHHFSEEEKIGLYRKIYIFLHDGGNFVEGDYTCKTMKQQRFHITENERLRKENGITDGFYHYDTPFTAETQIKLLKSVGFTDVQVVKEWESTSIIIARK
jgi:tRNA (cmo5U34)-methyltransferase